MLQSVLTACWDEVSVRDEEFVAVMFLQNIREDLQGKAFFLSGLLTPLVWVYFGVGEVCIVVFVFYRTRERQRQDQVQTVTRNGSRKMSVLIKQKIQIKLVCLTAPIVK